MSWVIRIDGQEVCSDDFTLSELERVEKESDTPWSVANPLRSAAVARVFLKVALIKLGRDPVEVDTWTLRQLKTMFDYRADEPAAAEVGGEPDPLDRSSPSSSPGAHSGSGGHRKKRANSA